MTSQRLFTGRDALISCKREQQNVAREMGHGRDRRDRRSVLLPKMGDAVMTE
ncbi:hypothetical protein E4U54_004749, partial [Claviceps lovelessii]